MGAGEGYVGTELDLFAHAVNWKRYFARRLAAHLKGSVLEVGAGLGGTTAVLCDPSRRDPWVCLEPDPGLVAQIERKIASGALPSCCRAIAGTLAQLAPELRFDTILYVDVLEHLADDAAEMRAAAARLQPDGAILVMSPAHPWLFSPFDAAIGHFRR